MTLHTKYYFSVLSGVSADRGANAGVYTVLIRDRYGISLTQSIVKQVIRRLLQRTWRRGEVR